MKPGTLVKGPNRFDYVKYDQIAQAKSAAFKGKCIELEELVKGFLGGNGYGPRAAELALQALEECFMWCGKAIRDEQVYQRTADLQEERTNS